MRALAKVPADRFTSATAFADEVSEPRMAAPAPATPTADTQVTPATHLRSRTWVTRAAWLLLPVALAALVGPRVVTTVRRLSLQASALDSTRYAAMWAALQHALRNAVDHGLEPAAARVAENKPEVGRIDLRARQEVDKVVIEIEDDGRGIAWDQLRQRVELRGVVAPSERDLVLALFGGRISTSASLSEVSGRGVGMGALKAAVDALKGDLDLASTPRRGTCLRLTLPAAPLPIGALEAPPLAAFTVNVGGGDRS